MAFNGSGTFNRLYKWATDALNALNISSSRMDGEMDGMATALSNCMTRDGQSPPTANIPMGGFKLTGLLAGVNPTDAANVSQIVASEWTLETLGLTYVSATSFKTAAGDTTTRYTAGRRIRTTNTGGTVYSTVVSSSYSAPDTTIVVVNDSGVVDSGLATLAYGLSYANPSYLDPRSNVLLDNNAVDLVLASTALQKVSFSNEVADALSEYAAGTFTAKYPGRYLAIFSFATTVQASAVVVGYIYKSGVAQAAGQAATDNASGQIPIMKVLSLTAGQTIEFHVQRDGTANSVAGRIDLTYASINRLI